MTIKDIAKLAGVSVSTVSRVLNNHPDVSKEAYKKVMAVVEEHNYIPNTSARDLGKSSTDNIGLVVRGIANPFYTKIIHAIEKKIENAGYTMVMQQIGSQEDEIMAGAIMERDKKLQGLIFLGGKLDYTPSQVSAINIPFVCCTFNNKYGSLDKDSFSSVCIDDNQAAYDAVECLYNQGHRKIAVLLSGPADGSVSQVRFEGYERALKDFGLELDENLIISTNSYGIKEAYEGTKEWLKNNHDFTAIFAIADNIAIGAMRALNEAGVSVPEDCSVLAIDGIEISEYMNPTLSTLCQPMKEMGSDAVEILIDIIEGRGTHKQVVLPTTYRSGNSVSQI